MLLSVDDLAVTYRTSARRCTCRRRRSAWTFRRAMLGLVGESGCGKTTLARAIMGVLPPNAQHPSGPHRVRRHRPAVLAARTAARDAVARPGLRAAIGDELARSRLSAPRSVARGPARARWPIAGAADERAAELFRAVGLDPSRLTHYPHQFSGGMRQRAAIALALALKPRLVIADEPVTALDVIVQRQVLDTFQDLSDDLQLSAIVVTHDVSVVAFLCDLTAVMYAGQVVEYGATRDVLRAPAHPYTMGLMNAFPDLDRDAETLVSIEGAPPSLLDPPPGCRFAPRCSFAERHAAPQIRHHLAMPIGQPASAHDRTGHRRRSVALLQRTAQRGRPVARTTADRARRRWRRSGDRSGRKRRPGRRIGLRQDHAWPTAAAPPPSPDHALRR